MTHTNENPLGGTEVENTKNYIVNIAEKISANVAGERVAMTAETPANYDANDYLLDHGVGAL